MAFKNQLSIIQQDVLFVIAVDGQPTGQIYGKKEAATAEVLKIRAERKAKRETPKTK